MALVFIARRRKKSPPPGMRLRAYMPQGDLVGAWLLSSLPLAPPASILSGLRTLDRSTLSPRIFHGQDAARIRFDGGVVQKGPHGAVCAGTTEAHPVSGTREHLQVAVAQGP